jgi:DNA-binding Xre family transcriptional regulator
MTTAKKIRNDEEDIPEITPAQWQRAKRGVRAGRAFRVPLSAIRRVRQKTQVDVADKTGMTQGIVSRLETREELDDVRVGTLRRYVEALGGELELVARFPDRHFVVSGGPKTRG